MLDDAPRIVNPAGERLACALHAGAPGRRAVVVLGHGLTSDKDRPWSEALAAALAAEGIAALRIAFAGNGASEGRFVDATITKEVADLGAVIDAFDGWSVGYVGHSMGGAVGLVRAARDERIRALVSLAAITDAVEFETRMLGHLADGEPILGKPHCPFGRALRDDLHRHGSLARLAPRVHVPWLAVHGSDDDVVPFAHSAELRAAAPERVELVRLDGVDHSFSGSGLPRLIDAVVPWLVQRMSEV